MAWKSFRNTPQLEALLFFRHQRRSQPEIVLAFLELIASVNKMQYRFALPVAVLERYRHCSNQTSRVTGHPSADTSIVRRVGQPLLVIVQ